MRTQEKQDHQPDTAGVFLITRGAVVKRINRRLAPEQLMLRTTRGRQMQNDYGPYYIYDLDRNGIHTHHVDIEHFARNNGLLAAHEVVSGSTQ